QPVPRDGTPHGTRGPVRAVGVRPPHGGRGTRPARGARGRGPGAVLAPGAEVTIVSGIDADRQRRLILAAQHKAHLTVGELWRRYFELGGTASPLEVDAFLNGAMALPGDQRDRLSLAVNEHLDSLAGQRRAPYSRPLREIEP